MAQLRRGYLFGVAAYLCWGLFPLYWKLLRPATPVEILAHRVVWSLVFVALIITASRHWAQIRTLLRRPDRLRLIMLASVVIGVNWGVYIYGVNSDRVVETSLGYFINPLVTVLLGVFVLRERLRRLQWVAIGVGAAAVAVLTADYGHVPYLALSLAVSFGLYGLIKKRLAVPATNSLLMESAVLALPALAYIGVLIATDRSTFGQISLSHSLLVIAAGLVTSVPLLLFAGAANRIPLSALGLLQYLAPVLQLGCGVLVYHEPMPPARLAGFMLVWVALAIFTWDGIRSARSTRATTLANLPDPARV
ncbi:MAG TPA: EamA family transporter RarD [Micromonosporaceae bacterium]